MLCLNGSRYSTLLLVCWLDSAGISFLGLISTDPGCAGVVSISPIRRSKVSWHGWLVWQGCPKRNWPRGVEANVHVKTQVHTEYPSLLEPYPTYVSPQDISHSVALNLQGEFPAKPLPNRYIGVLGFYQSGSQICTMDFTSACQPQAEDQAPPPLSNPVPHTLHSS